MECGKSCMYIIIPRATTAKTLQRNALKDMHTNKLRWNPKKSTGSQEKRNRSGGNRKVIKWHTSSIRSISVLNIVGQNIVIKFQILIEWIKKHHLIIYIDKKPTAN